MPIYAFVCAACGHRFDRLQRLADPDPSDCPDCGASAIKRQLTAPSFRLSGSGWYETDFKKDGDRKRNLAGEGGEGARTGEAGKADKTDKPAESKPDAKTDTKPAAGGKPEPKPVATKPDSKSGSKPAAG